MNEMKAKNKYTFLNIGKNNTFLWYSKLIQTVFSSMYFQSYLNKLFEYSKNTLFKFISKVFTTIPKLM